MLRHLTETEAADRIETAVRKVIRDGTSTTHDLGGSGSTDAYAEAIIQAMP